MQPPHLSCSIILFFFFEFTTTLRETLIYDFLFCTLSLNCPSLSQVYFKITGSQHEPYCVNLQHCIVINDTEASIGTFAMKCQFVIF